jgi:SAM-dependent methyltransferase
MSWDEAFADGYEEWSAGMTADIAFYVQLAVETDGPLVELAIGNGRVAIPVAQATGKRVIGIDLSPAMLDQARTRAAGAGVALDLRGGDMRDLVLDEPAGLIYSPYRALLHLPTWADRRRTFRAGGRIAPAGRPVRLECARLRSSGRRATGWAAEPGTGTAHDPLRRR